MAAAAGSAAARGVGADAHARAPRLPRPDGALPWVGPDLLHALTDGADAAMAFDPPYHDEAFEEWRGVKKAT